MESTSVEQLPISQKALAWFETNKKPVAWGTVILLFVVLVVSVVVYRHTQKEIAAGEALSSAAVPQMAGARTGSADAFLKVAADHANSKAAGRALLLAAGVLFRDGKYAEARTQFERFRKDYPDSPFVGEAMFGMAACAEAQGEARKAMTGYKELIDRRAGDYVLPQAKYALARLHEAQNEPEQARNLYEEIDRTDPYGSVGDEARMRLEDLKTKYPKLFAAPVAPPAVAGTNIVLPPRVAPTGTNPAAPAPAPKR